MNRKTSIIRQVAIIFVLGIFLIGILTFLSVQYISARSVDEQTTAVADSVTNEVKQAVTEYPAHPFLLRYWYEHAREMELEYDATYEDGVKTELQCRIWYKNHPDMPLDYVTEEQIEALPAEDQRIFAEIMYSAQRIPERREARNMNRSTHWVSRWKWMNCGRNPCVLPGKTRET